MNRAIRQLSDDLLKVLNGYDLPVEVKRIVVDNLHSKLEKQADIAILSEIQTIVETGDLDNAESTRQ